MLPTYGDVTHTPTLTSTRVAGDLLITTIHYHLPPHLPELPGGPRMTITILAYDLPPCLTYTAGWLFFYVTFVHLRGDSSLFATGT